MSGNAVAEAVISPDGDRQAYASMIERAIELAAAIGPAMSALPNAADSNVIFTGEQFMALGLGEGQESCDSLNGLDMDLQHDETEQVGEDPGAIAAGVEMLNLLKACEDDSNSEDNESETMSDIVQPFEGGGGMTLDSVIELMIELTELLVSLKGLFSRSSRAEQEMLTNQFASLPGALEKFYSLLFDIFEREYF